MNIKRVIELENSTFADVIFEGGTHVYLRGVEDPAYATMYDDSELDDLNDLYNELLKFNDVGFGFDSEHSEWQFHGNCIIPKQIREIELILR